MTTCTRRIQFCAGHRILGHESKCAHVHGHNYVAFITARADKGLDDVGRVVDFSVLKERIGWWIDRNWDHGFIANEADAYLVKVLEEFNVARDRKPECGGIIACPEYGKLYTLDCNPTAENMAAHLVNVVAPQELLHEGVHVTKVQLWETENCYAEAMCECESKKWG